MFARRPPSLRQPSPGRVAVPTALLALILTSLPSLAADWVMLAGSEEGKPEKAITPVAFTQIVLESTPFAAPVTGLESDALKGFNGEQASFNVEGPFELVVRRVRLGARGTVPMTNRAVTYFLSVDAGKNAATRGIGLNLIDASVSVHVIPGLRLRFGQFKLPTMDETLEANPLTADFINFSPAVLQLMLEQPVGDGGFLGPAFANRDLGVMGFDSAMVDVPIENGGALELAWAGAITQGQFGDLDTDHHKDLSGRLMLSWLPKPAQRFKALREEVSVYAWHLEGQRVVDETDFLRRRQGLGLHARLFHTRLRAELVRAEGMIFTGQSPPFEGQPVGIDPSGDAWGWTWDVGVERLGPFEIDAGIEELWRYADTDPRHRLQRNVVLGLQYKWTEQVKIMANYEFRHLGVAKTTPDDARTIAASMADAFLLQVTMTL